MLVFLITFEGLLLITVSGQCMSNNRPLTLNNRSGVIKHPNYRQHYYGGEGNTGYTYTSKQRCTWEIEAEQSDILLLQFNYLATGVQSIHCPNNFVVLPNGLRICGNSRPKNCYAFASKGMIHSGYPKNLPQCGCSMQIYELDSWPPTIRFRSNGRKSLGRFAVNYTLVPCPPEMITNDTTLPEESKTEKIMREAQELARKHLSAFTAAVIVCGFLLVVAVFLSFLLIREKKKFRTIERKVLKCQPLAPPSATDLRKTQPQPALPSTSGDQEYVNSMATETEVDEYGYVKPNVFGNSQYERRPKSVYVEFN